MSKTRGVIQFLGTAAVVVLGVQTLSTVAQAVYPSKPVMKEGFALAMLAPPADANSSAGQAAASSKPIAVAQAAAPAGGDQATPVPDAKLGATVFTKCKACHTIESNGKNGTGPNLYGLINRPVASVASFKYSDGMKARSSENWTPALLDTYLTNVKGTVPGTKMAFAGLTDTKDRQNLIAFLAQASDKPIAPDQLHIAAAASVAATTADAPATAAPAATTPAADVAAAPAAATPAPVTYNDPSSPTADQIAAEKALGDALNSKAKAIDYQRNQYSSIHFKPEIDKASNAECLACHQEVLDTKVRDKALDGIKAQDSLAWYQTLATYDGPQMTFHQRHLTSPYAQSVMNLKCTFCHQGNDVREESPHMTVAAADMTSNNGAPPFTLRKMVNPTETCLRCHGAMPDPVNIMGLPAPWPQARKDMETPDQPNGCLTCHAELFRTNRHKVSYLNAATIEDLAKESSDVCYGCHGGRAWYRIPYNYPRHPWPGMDPTVPDWAKNRKTESDLRYMIKDTK